MRVLLADTFYWIALLNPRDSWHQTVLTYGRKHPDIHLVVTDGIIDEVLNHFAEQGTFLRNNALSLCRSIETDLNIEILHYTPRIAKARI
jgi:uncharacterized protein